MPALKLLTPSYIASILRVVGLIVVALVCCTCSNSPQVAGGGPADSPSSVVKKFWEAINRLDFAGAAKFVQDGDKFDPSLPLWKDTQLGARDGIKANFSVQIVSESVAGTTATVQATVNADFAGTSNPQKDTVTLTRQGAVWLITSQGFAQEDAQNKPTMSMAFMLAHSNDLDARNRSKAVSCVSNVKQLSLAMLMYASDFDQTLPQSGVDEFAVMQPYFRNQNLLHCPSDTGSASSYAINSLLLGTKIALITEPANTVGVYEGKGQNLEFRHDGSASVGFIDGHAKKIMSDNARSLLWAPPPATTNP